MDRKKWIYGGVAVVLLILIVWAVSTAPQTPTAADSSGAARVMSYEDNTLTEERDGRTVWTLTAKQLEVDLDTQDASMYGIEGTFYSEDGRTLTLKADEGHMDHETRDVVLTGSVNAVMSDGANLTANELPPRGSWPPQATRRSRGRISARRATALRAQMNSGSSASPETHG